MKYRRLGTTSIVVSEMAFGGWAIGGSRFGNSYGPTEDATSLRAIDTALDLGCTLIDTADVYGRGRSESLIGRALARAKKRHRVAIATKVGTNFTTGEPVRDFSAAHIRCAVDASLRRLRRDYIDVYQLHNPALDVLTRGEAVDALLRLKRAGKIRHCGVSIHAPREGMECIRRGDVEVLQLGYNLLSLLDGGVGTLMRKAVKAGVGILAREPLANGFLSGRHTLRTRYAAGDFRATMTAAERRTFVSLVRSLDLSGPPGVSRAQLALRFVLDEPAVSSTIVGIKTPHQAAENFAAVDLPSFTSLIETGASKSRRTA